MAGELCSGDKAEAYYWIRVNNESRAFEELVLEEKGKGCWGKPFESEWRKTDSATSKLYYTVTVFPNKCVASPPYPLPYTP